VKEGSDLRIPSRERKAVPNQGADPTARPGIVGPMVQARRRALWVLLLSALVAGCASPPPPLPEPRWVPPPKWAKCTDEAPCENVATWFKIEKEAAEAWPACHPVPLPGSAVACEKAALAYARVHEEQLDYFSSMCAGMVGVNAWAIRPYVGAPQNDRVGTCGGKSGIPPFTCRLWEWTWVAETKGGAFVVFLVEAPGAGPGVWAVNNCSYCVAGGSCRDFPPRP